MSNRDFTCKHGVFLAKPCKACSKKRRSKKPEIRPIGDIMASFEELAVEFFEHHDMQHGEVLALIHDYNKKHYPGYVEEYEDGTVPRFYYGHKQYLKKYLK